MKIITFHDIKNLNIPSSLCLEWVSETIKNKKKAILPPKISLKPYDGVFCNVMPGIISMDTENICGVKVVTRYPERIPSLESQILLMNADNGEHLAFLDGTWITAMRTGAVAAHSIITLAKPQYKVIGMMGLGNVSRSTLLTLLDKFPDREFIVKLLKYKGQEENFKCRFKKYQNVHFIFVDSVKDMVKGSDIVISGATYLPDDVCSEQYFDEGVLVQPIHTLGFTNCDLFFDKVFADDYGHVCHFKNFNKFKSFAEVNDVVNGIKAGRENEKERIIVYNIGLSIHDLSFAAHIYKLLKDIGKLDSLPEISTGGVTEKFWV